MPKSILNDSYNLLHWYMYAVGETEVPREFHMWSCLSLVAACLGDRVWYQKSHHERVYPNLFVGLLGTSGTGKGNAMGIARRYILQLNEDQKRVRNFWGHTNGQALLELLGTKKRDGQKANPEKGKLYLMQEELSQCVPSGPPAGDFVKAVTSLYQPTPLYEKHTITGGTITIHGLCLNWLFGSTMKWCLQTLDYDSLVSGFGGRILPVVKDHDPAGRRIYRIQEPENLEEVQAAIFRRLKQLTRLSGEFVLSKQADAAMKMWYESRPVPSDDDELSMWKRAQDQVLKILMILSICETPDLVGYARNFSSALTMYTTTQQAMPTILQLAQTSRDTDGLDRLREYMKAAEVAKHSTVMKYLSKRGFDARRLSACVATLLQTGEIRQATNAETHAKWYKWTGNRKVGGKHADSESG